MRKPRNPPAKVLVSNRGGTDIHHPDAKMPLDQRAHEMWAVHPVDIANLGFATREAFVLAHLQASVRDATRTQEN